MNKTRIPEEYVLFRIAWQHRNSIQHLEREYLDLRIQLRDAETDLRSDPQNNELMSRAEYLKDRIKDLEKIYLDFHRQTSGDSFLGVAGGITYLVKCRLRFLFF